MEYDETKYKDLVDFQSYKISHYNFDYQKPFMLVDGSYYIFYRYFAMRMWYSMSHKEKYAENNKIEKYDWMADTVFMDKFNKTFFENLLKLVKKNKIPLSNLIISLDCPSWEIWRQSITTNYKSTRKESHIKAKFFCYKIFAHSDSKLILPFVNENKCHLVRYKNAEADDVNGILLRHITSVNPDASAYIIATDHDYIQLCDSKVCLLDAKGKNLSEKILNDDMCQIKFLIIKILIGDVSDNIIPCNISTKFLIDNKLLGKSNKKFIKCSKSNVKKIIENAEIYKTIVDLYNSNLINRNNNHINNKLFENERFLKNQQLIDFRFIPSSIKNSILEIFKLT